MSATGATADGGSRRRALILLITLALTTQMTISTAGNTAGAAPSPVKWHRQDNSPVLDAGPQGAWDEGGVFTRCVLFDGTSYALYYEGVNASADGIGLATSPDEVNWTKYSGNPVLTAGSTGAWDCNGVGGPWVVTDGQSFKMWYGGNDGAKWRIGLATSSDGMAWTKYSSNPVLSVGNPGEWDGDGIASPSILFEGGRYILWYSGQNGSIEGIGRADSTDGIVWTPSAANPVLGIGSASWENRSVSAPCVLNMSGIFRMWYSGYDGHNWAVGSANSTDGIAWTRYPGNPVLHRFGGDWESHDALLPCVIFNGTGYTMWYTGVDSSFIPRTGRAEGWNQLPDPPVLLAPGGNLWTNHSRPEFSWLFSDADVGDTQGAFEVQLSGDVDFNTVDYSSGKIVSNLSSFIPASGIPDGIWNWRVRVWDNYDDNSTWSNTSTVKIDTSPPQNPANVTSAGHPTRVWSSDPIVRVCWTLPEGGGNSSGYAGFSILWDNQPGTLPDTIADVEAGACSTASPALLDGDNHYFHIRAVDNAGNWANGSAQAGPFFIDSTPPGSPASLTSPSHETGVWSNNRTVELEWALPDASISGLAGYSGVWDTYPLTIPPPVANISRDSDYLVSTPLPDGNPWYFHLRALDSAGNWGTAAAHAGPFLIDATPPEISEFSILGNLTVTNGTSVTVRLVATDPLPGTGLSEMRFSAGMDAWTEWMTYNEIDNIQLGSGDGPTVLFAQVRDKLGNECLPSTASIMADRKAPESVALRINGGANSTNSTSVVLEISAADPVPGAGLSEVSLRTEGEPWGKWLSYQPIINYTLTSGDGPKTLYLRVRDSAGNIGSIATGEILLDTVAPMLTSPNLAGGMGYHNNLTVPMLVTASDAEPSSGISQMSFSEDGAVWSGWYPFSRATTYTFSPGEGVRTLFLRVRDAAGNCANPVSGSILIDTQPPLIRTVFVSGVSDELAVVTWYTDELTSGIVDFGKDLNYGGSLSDTTCSTQHSLVLPNLAKGTYYHVRVRAMDIHDNGPSASPDVIFQTAKTADRSSPRIYSPRVGTLTNDKALILWETDEPADSIVEYGMTKELGSTLTNPVLTQFHSILLSDLSPGTTYFFIVKSTDPSLNPPGRSGRVSFYTPLLADTSPAVVLDVEVSGISENSAVVSWSTNEYTIGTLEAGPGSAYIRTVQTDGFSLRHSVVLTGLQPASEYHFRVGGVDIAGNAPLYSPDKELFTAASPDITPPGLERVKVLSTGPNWAVVDADISEPATILVDYGSSRSYGKMIASPDFFESQTVVIYGLTPDTTYHFKIFASDPAGNGPGSSVDMTFRTAKVPAAASVPWTLLGVAVGLLVVIVAVLAVAGYRRSARGKPKKAAPTEISVAIPEPPGPPVPAVSVPRPEPEPARTAGSQVSMPPTPDATGGLPFEIKPHPEEKPSAQIAPPARLTAPIKIDIADLEEPVPRREKTAEERWAAEMAARESMILKMLSSLPRGLPSSLWGIDMEDLAARVVRGERRDSPDGDILVKINNRWYFGDEANIGQFMQEYKK